MEIKNINLVELKPSEGMVLTNGVVYSDTSIYIGCNNSADEYYEITLEEYAEILKKMEENTEMYDLNE